jgi:WD40 repeat protein
VNGETGRLVRVLRADNQGDVEAVAWSPDGRWLASGSDDNKVRIWDRESGLELRRFEGHTHWVYSVSWSPDGRRLASGSLDKTVRIWEAETGDEWRRLEGHNGFVYAVSWAPDVRWLASGSADRTVRIWNADTGQERRRLEGHTGSIRSVSWSSDGRWLASGSDDRTVRIWDAEAGLERRPLEGHTDWVNSVLWSPDGRRLASGSSDQTVRIWETDTGREHRRLDGHRCSVHTVSLSPDGRWLASGSDDRTVRIWDVETGQERRRLDGHTGVVFSVSWSRDGRSLASGCSDDRIRIWDVAELAPAARPIAGDDPVAAYVARQAATVGRRAVSGVAEPWVPHLAEAQGDCLGVLRGTGAGSRGGHEPSVALLPGGRRLASGSPDGLVRVWDLANGTPLWQGGTPHGNRVMDVACSADGRWLASGSLDATVRIWDAETGQDRRQPGRPASRVVSVSWSRDSRWLASGTDNRGLRIWDVETGEERRGLEGQMGAVYAVSWSPDGRWLASGSDDNTVRIWVPESGQERRRLDGHTSSVWSVSWSRDGRWLASGSGDRTARIWDVETAQERRRLEGHTGSVYSVSWSPDGRWLASGADDKTVRIWDAETGQEVSRFTFEENNAWRLAWSPDGAFLASSHKGDVFRFWDTRRFAVSRQLPVALSPVSREVAGLPAALAELQGMGLYPPLSLVRDLLRLTGGLAIEGPAAALAEMAGLRKLSALRWPTAARVGLVASLLRRVPMVGWEPPAVTDRAQFREHLAAAMGGEMITPQAPDPPLVPLQRAFAGVDDRFLTLLAMLGKDAVAADPALIVRLSRKLPALPALADPRRRLLGLRLDRDGGGYAQGQGPGTERAGVQRRGDLRSLVSSQLALPESVLEARLARGELLYRAKAGREPPQLRAVVLMLDVSPASFGPVEATTRLAAYVLASTLQQARLPVWLVTAGGAGTAAPLEQPGDLVEIWSRRTLEPPRPARALAAARGLRATLVGQSVLEPVIVLLAQANFGALEEVPMPSGLVPGLRGLFVHHVGQAGRPAWSTHCERWLTVSAGNESRLIDELGTLLA